MWKKALAVLCVPVVLWLAISVPVTMASVMEQPPVGSAGFRGGYWAGTVAGLLITVAVLFFLSRWIVRTLRGPR